MYIGEPSGMSCYTFVKVISEFVFFSQFAATLLGQFIREKIRRELDHLYEHVLFKTKTAHINGSRLISVLDSFSCKCCP